MKGDRDQVACLVVIERIARPLAEDGGWQVSRVDDAIIVDVGIAVDRL